MKAPSPLGREIRRLRHERKLTLRALAKRASIPATTIHSLETGQAQSTRAERLEAIARALRVSSRRLLRTA